VDIWNGWRTFEYLIFTLHKRFDFGVCIHPVFVHVLQLRKVVQHLEEYIVQNDVFAALQWHMQSRKFEMAAATLKKLQGMSVSLLKLLKQYPPVKSGEADA
jgi:hypothetical protein